MDTANQLQQLLESLRDGRADARRAAQLAPGWSPSRHPSFLDYLASCGALRAASAEDQATATVVRPAASPRNATTQVVPTWDGGAAPPTTVSHPAGGPGAAQVSGPAVGSGRRYEPIRLHKSGGLGQVWLARDTVLGRDVALKVVRPDRAGRADLVARFLLEARVTGRLEHPGIVPLYDLVESRDAAGGAPCYVMRYVSGGTLADAVETYHERHAAGEATALDFRGLIDALVAVCRAVAFAHSRGVLHRDLKGQNVVLGEFGEVFLLDFGLTKLTGRSGDPAALPPDGAGDETAVGTISGTPAYMAPEVAAGGDASEASDVYGLGAMLYAALTGKAPAEGATPRDVLRKVCSADPPPPRAVNPAASRALAAVCRKAMARDPRNRYAGAAELATDLQRWLADEPVAARREPLPDRVARWARRHRPAAVAAAAAVGAVAAVLAASTALLWSEQRATEAQRLEAVEQRDRAEASLDAAHRLTTRLVAVSERVLPPLSDSEPARLELTRAAADAFGLFAVQRPDSLEFRLWSAQLRRYEANMLRFMGDALAAEASYGVALTALRGEPAGALRLAETLRDSAGLLQLMGRLREARAALAEAQGLLDRLRAADSERVEFRRVEAFVRHDVAAAECAAGRPAAAADSAGQSAALLRALVARPGAARSPYNEVMLASALTYRAAAERARGDCGAARSALAEAAAVVDPLVGAPVPGLVRDDATYVQAAAVFEGGLLAESAGGGAGRAAAEAALTLAAGRFADLAARRPHAPNYRAQLAKVLAARGRLRHAGGDPAGAADLDAARAHFEALAAAHLAVPDYRAELGRACLGLSLASAPDAAPRWREQGVACLRAALAACPDGGDIRASLDAALTP